MEIIRQGRNIIIQPNVHRATLVWLHGLGDTAEGFLPVFKARPLHEGLKYVLLTAPMREVTANFNMRMPSWYDIKDFSVRKMNPQVTESAQIVSEVLDQEREAGKPVLLGGFSQGGGLSLYTGLVHYEHKLAGLISMSAYGMNYQPRADRTDVPIFLYNGKADEVVKSEMALNSYKILDGFNKTLHLEDSLGHVLSMRGLNILKAWIAEVLAE